MICPRCKADVPDAPYCCQCGRNLQRKVTHKKRGNGEGTITIRNGKYRATVTLGYWLDEEGKKHRKTRSKTFDLKKDAVAALVTLRTEKEKAADITLDELHRRWEPTHRAGDSTMGCYRAAWRYFADLKYMSIREITVDDLQECLDDCPKGKRTKENMRALLGLMYKYAIPRKWADMNLASYLVITGDKIEHKEGFTKEQIEQFWKHSDNEGVKLILCMIYTGFRPSEFLALKGKDYDRERGCLIGGAKTEAGKGRVVTVSPKIQPFIPCGAADAPLWGFRGSLKQFTENVFYPSVALCGVENPISAINGVKRHKYTPHSCRHTFATLMKGVPGADKDKLELIGHSSTEMLRYYQDVGIEDLRKITDNL